MRAFILALLCLCAACTPEQRKASGKSMAAQQCRDDYPRYDTRYFDCMEALNK